jgi:hypothetical protein
MTEPAPVEPTEPTEPVEPIERPEYIPEKFWDGEKGEARLEDAFKSYTALEQKMAGKKQAPEAYELAFDDSIEKEFVEDITADDDLVKGLMDIAKESDMSQEGFGKLMSLIVGSEVAQLKEMEEARKNELAALGEHGSKRIKEMNAWIDSNLDKDLADALKASMTSAKAVEAMEKIKESSKAPSLKAGDDLDPSLVATHDDLRKRQFAKDEFGNRLMQNPEYRKKWQQDAEAANYMG